MPSGVAPSPTHLLPDQPDFKALAAVDAAFGAALKKTKARAKALSLPLGGVVDDEFNLCLTRAILKAHFGYGHFSIPPGYLVPPVPNRQRYLEWLRTLLVSGGSDAGGGGGGGGGLSVEDGTGGREGGLLGLDVGTGASCIYPLLGARMGWRFLATDVDEESVQNARRIVREVRFFELVWSALGGSEPRMGTSGTTYTSNLAARLAP